jgi:hypothetical protein
MGKGMGMEWGKLLFWKMRGFTRGMMPKHRAGKTRRGFVGPTEIAKRHLPTDAGQMPFQIWMLKS